MSPQHPPHALLERFVAGELPESLAVELALHLDDCPACSAECAVMEPLAAAFAQSPDPEVPPELVSSLLEQLDSPQMQPELPPALPAPLPLQARAELLAGGTLLSVAATLFFVFGEPTQLAADLAVGAHAAATAASIGASSMDSAALAWPAMLAALILVGSVVVYSLIKPQGYGRRF